MARLTTEHLQYLHDRGVTDSSVIEARGYESTDTGLTIPIWTLPDGDRCSSETRLDERGEDGRKFTRPKGSSNRLNVNPLMVDKVRDAKHTLLVVEGTTRADALAQRGIPAVSLTGCWGWMDTKHGTLPEWRDIPIADRKVIWVPDGDAWTNPQVNKASIEFITFMRRKRARHISILELPQHQGLDDWFASGGDLLGMSDLMRPADSLPELDQVRLSRDKMAAKKGLPDTTDEALAELWAYSDPTHAVRVAGADIWYTYGAGRWTQDRTRDGLDARASLAALLTRVADKYQEAAETDAEKRVAQDTYRDLRSAAKLGAVYTRFRSLPREMVCVDDAQFDRDPYALNVANGTVDLHTGVLRPHDPADRLRGISPTSYQPQAGAPRWHQFLAEVFPNDSDTISYLQLVLGASLIGRPMLHVLPVLVGTGRNGKGTLVRALTTALGRDYMGACDRSLLISSKFESHPTKLMALKGKRLVTASETEAGEKLAAASLKQLTGGDELSARGMREDQQTFMPSHNMILMTNNLPEVDSQDKALWSRLKLIRFTQSFEDAPDRRLDEKLAAEAEGILLWLVEGCRRFLQQDGELEDPVSVIGATGDWRMEGDTLSQFMSARVIRDPKAEVLASDLRDAYGEFCREQGEQPLTPQMLGRLLPQRPGVEKCYHPKLRTVSYRGLRIATREDISLQREDIREDIEATATPLPAVSRGREDREDKTNSVTVLDSPHDAPTSIEPDTLYSSDPLDPLAQSPDLREHESRSSRISSRDPLARGDIDSEWDLWLASAPDRE